MITVGKLVNSLTADQASLAEGLRSAALRIARARREVSADGTKRVEKAGRGRPEEDDGEEA